MTPQTTFAWPRKRCEQAAAPTSSSACSTSWRRATSSRRSLSTSSFRERGPIGYNGYGIQAALRVLKPDGLLFCEMIGNLHHQEVSALFGPGLPHHQMIRTVDEARVAMERNGVSIRIASEIVTKRYYPSIYDWLEFQCGIWAWGGGPLPSADDPRLALFAERNTTESGEIETTHHVVWVGGVKARDSYYAERSYFGRP